MKNVVKANVHDRKYTIYLNNTIDLVLDDCGEYGLYPSLHIKDMDKYIIMYSIINFNQNASKEEMKEYAYRAIDEIRTTNSNEEILGKYGNPITMAKDSIDQDTISNLIEELSSIKKLTLKGGMKYGYGKSFI